ncbi:MAG: UxaA family hydrolase [Chloroflexota bacterium]|nr:UxaA family hydrolase [Chloroflexota bacterium]
METSERRLVHVLHAADNVATALVEIPAGTTVAVEQEGQQTTVTVGTVVPFGHKLAQSAIPRGQPVIKYGEVIGLATQDIAPGEHVHVHNVESQRGRGDLART